MSQSYDEILLAILFAVGEPILPQRIADALEMDAETIARLLNRLADKLDEQPGAFQIMKLEQQYQLTTREEYTPQIKKVLAERRNALLSAAALEVLAAVAYNQPVTRAYVEQVRGVDSTGLVTSLVEKGLIEEAGRLDLPGRPIAYKTTAHFLRTFGISSLKELPVMADLAEEEMAEMPEDWIDGQIAFDQSAMEEMS